METAATVKNRKGDENHRLARASQTNICIDNQSSYLPVLDGALFVYRLLTAWHPTIQTELPYLHAPAAYHPAWIAVSSPKVALSLPGSH